MINAFTVDVEDYFQVQAFARNIRRDAWESFESRVVGNTHRILDLLDSHGVRATFFILGWTAHRHPRLVEDIDRAGHDIGCHSYWHRLIYEQTPDEFRDDLRLATRVISDLTGKPLTAYRAPCFSITDSSRWALDILHDEGYRLDSSIFPVYHDHYGIPGALRHPHWLECAGGRMHEFPPTVVRLARVNIPISGGGYFRLLPLRATISGIRHVNRIGRPFMFYIHPWEIDPEQPRIRAGWKSTFRHYHNLHTTFKKLDRLIAGVPFGPMTDALEHELSNQNVC